MSQPFKLYRLQQLDSQIDQAQTRLAEIEEILSDDATLRRIQDHFETSESSLNDARKALRKAEFNVSDQEHKIEQNQTALYGGKISNPKELQDLQNENEALKRYLSVLEDRQLEAMLAVENAEAEYQNAQEELQEIQAKTANQHKVLIAERTQLEKETERFENERQATAAAIDEADLRLYVKLRKKLSGVAVAKVKEKVCSACGSTLAAASLQAARSPTQITRCDTCGRILYGG